MIEEIGDNEAEALKFANEGYSTKNLPEAENRGFGISSTKSMIVEGLGGAFLCYPEVHFIDMILTEARM